VLWARRRSRPHHRDAPGSTAHVQPCGAHTLPGISPRARSTRLVEMTREGGDVRRHRTVSPRAKPRGLRTRVGRSERGAEGAFEACHPERSRGGPGHEWGAWQNATMQEHDAASCAPCIPHSAFRTPQSAFSSPLTPYYLTPCFRMSSRAETAGAKRRPAESRDPLKSTNYLCCHAALPRTTPAPRLAATTSRILERRHPF
jgi:hypothetical protein